MQVSIVYPGQTGAQADYSIPFEYLSKDHVKATVNGVQTSFTFNSTYVIHFATKPVGTLRVYRETPSDVSWTTFVDGSVLVADELNGSFKQALFVSQEVADKLPGKTTDGHWDALNLRWKNLSDPVDNQDAATKGWVNTSYNSGVDAGVAKAAAESARDIAVAAASSASGNASTAVSKASEAIGARDTAVSKASEAVTAAATAVSAKDTAVAKAAAAATSETNAAASAAAAATFNPANYVTKTGAEELTNKTLTTPALILEHSAGFAQTALGRMGLDETAMAVMFGDGTTAQPLRPSAERLVAEYKITTGVSTLLLPDLTKYSMIEIVASTTSTAAWTLYFQPSYDGGVTYDTTTSNYYGNTWGLGNGSWVSSTLNAEPGFRIMCFSASANSFAMGRALITNLRGGKRSICGSLGRMWQSDGAIWGLDGMIFNSTQSPVTKGRIITNAGATITGHIAVKGWLA